MLTPHSAINAMKLYSARSSTAGCHKVESQWPLAGPCSRASSSRVAMSWAFSAGSSQVTSRGLSEIAHHQTKPHNIAGAASTMNIVRHVECLRMKPEIGLAMTGATARLSRNIVLARARSGRVNHARSETIDDEFGPGGDEGCRQSHRAPQDQLHHDDPFGAPYAREPAGGYLRDEI